MTQQELQQYGSELRQSLPQHFGAPSASVANSQPMSIDDLMNYPSKVAKASSPQSDASSGSGGGYSATMNAAGNAVGDAVSRIGSDFAKRGQDIYDSIQATGDKIANNPNPDQIGNAGNAVVQTGKALLHGVGQLGAGVGDIVSEGAKALPDSVTNSPIVNDVKSAFKFENLDPHVQDLLTKFGHWMSSNPEVSSSLGDAANSAGLLAPNAAKAATDAAAPVVNAGIDAAKPVIGAAKDAVSTAADAMTAGRTAANDAKAFDASIGESQKVLNPTGKYTPSEADRLYQTGQVKTEGRGPFRKDVPNPTPNGTNETVAQLVRDGKVSAKASPAANISAIKQEARVADSNIDSFVRRPELNKPFNGGKLEQVFRNVDQAAKDNLIFVPDSTEEKAYRQVMDVAREEIAKNPYNSSGLRDSIKAFNGRMQDVLGKDIYGGAQESVGNARLQAAKDVRSKLNDFLADNLEAPGGTVKGGEVYRSELRKEAQLLNAADEISYRSRGTLGKSRASQYLNSHPKTKAALKYGAAAIGGEEAYRHLSH